MKKLLVGTLGLACALVLSAEAFAANVILINEDARGIGLNDPTPVKPSGGNPGTTVGEQRLIAYQFAADLWGSVLQSKVPIRVSASFADQPCDETTAILAGAGPEAVYFGFAGLEPIVLYHSALADALTGVNLSTPKNRSDIVSQFNGDLGKPGCLTGTGWYYGLDGKTPENTINFLNVAVHELAHGLGASGFVDDFTGELLANRPDVYSRLAFDNETNLRFADPAMTDALRAEAMTTPGRTVWDGANVKTNAALILDKRPGSQTLLVGADTAGRPELFAPDFPQPGSTFSHFSTSLSPDALMEPFDTPGTMAQFNIDLTASLLKDVGWNTRPGNARLGKCATKVPRLEPGGLIIGANVEATSKLCELNAKTSPRGYLVCMLDYSRSLREQKIVTDLQSASVSACAIKRNAELQAQQSSASR